VNFVHVVNFVPLEGPMLGQFVLRLADNDREVETSEAAIGEREHAAVRSVDRSTA